LYNHTFAGMFIIKSPGSQALNETRMVPIPTVNQYYLTYRLSLFWRYETLKLAQFRLLGTTK